MPVPPLPFRAVTFPLFGLSLEGSCLCSNASCERAGKHAKVLWSEVTETSPAPTPEPGEGYGIKTGQGPKGSGVVVIDCDSAEAIGTFEQKFIDAGEKYLKTLLVETPRGAHFYFQAPEFRVRNSVGKLAKGVDVRGDGGFVVGPGSPHKSKVSYKILQDSSPAPLPRWLRSWLEETSKDEGGRFDHPGEHTDPEAHVDALRWFDHVCKKHHPGVQGQKGDANLFSLVIAGARDCRLSDQEVFDSVLEHYNPRCVPPWSESELAKKVRHNSKKARVTPVGGHPLRTPPDRETLNKILSEGEPISFKLEPLHPKKIDDLQTANQESSDTETEEPKKKLNQFEQALADEGIKGNHWGKPLPPVSWCVDKLMASECISMLVAHGSSLKTWTSMSIAIAVAEGTPWLGKYETKKMRVILVDYEEGEYEMLRRIQILTRSPEDPHGRNVQGLYSWAYPAHSIDKPEFWKRINKIINAERSAANDGEIDESLPWLVVIDSMFAGTTPGVDENSIAAAAPMQLGGRWCEETGGTIIMIHHSKKDTGGDPRLAVRGSTAIYGSIDSCYGFQDVEESDGVRRMRGVCLKPSKGGRPPPFEIELSDDGLRAYDYKDLATSEPKEDQIESLIKKELNKGVCETVDLLARGIGKRKAEVLSALKTLLVRREVFFTPGLGYQNDNESLRYNRIKAAVESGRDFASSKILADACQVSKPEIEELIHRRVLRKDYKRFVFVESDG